MKITCIITDDEPFARKGLQGYVERIDFLHLEVVCEDALQLNSMLRNTKVDLLFLDIEMPYVTGIEFLRQQKNPPAVIFTTAYEKYAIDGFELDVLDYLLKPISFERFFKAANKAHDYYSLHQESLKNADYIFLKSNGKIEKIDFNSILYIEAMENYVTIYMEDRRVIANVTMKMILEKLPAAQFISTHKSFIVAISKIDSIEGNILHIDKYEVPISKYQKEDVLANILSNRFLKR